MLRFVYPLAFVTSALFPSFFIPPSLAQSANLVDGLICVAKGKTDRGATVYFYTSVIDNASIKKKKPVSVTILESTKDIAAGEVVIVDKVNQTITVDSFTATTPPELLPIGRVQVFYSGKNTFKGETKAGSNLSLILEPNYRRFSLKYINDTYTGVCQ